MNVSRDDAVVGTVTAFHPVSLPRIAGVVLVVCLVLAVVA
jgi:hypothetical protein